MILTPTKDKNRLLEELKIFKNYINGDLNNLNDLKSSCDNKYFKEIEKEILDIASHLENQNKESLTVYGEVMLACEKLSDGYTDDKIVAVSHDPKLNYISKTLNTMFNKLDHSINDIVTILDQYGDQNYLNTIDENIFRGGQLQKLMKGINNLKDKVTTGLCNSYRESMVLEHESMVLKEKAEILSASTQRQAVAIEETTAAVVEISSNITSNTKTAGRMLILGNEVKNSTINGEKLANDTYNSMDDINKSTDKVHEAISAISQIAFQTNILSLNAAVEATTAGEAGKGFSVVAQEVRNLAGRSAEVAKDIGALMDELKKQANIGKNIADDMRDDYQKLTININVAKNILSTTEKAEFLGKDNIQIRKNSLLRRDDNSDASMRGE